MRFVKVVAVVAVMGMAVAAMAALNQYGVADNQKVTFHDPIKVGETVLPKGEYNVQHTMEGQDHVMVFTQQKSSKPATVRVKCQLVKLNEKADKTRLLYNLDANNIHVLQEITFRGETAKHVF